ncbi:MAG: relaxase [Rhizobiaceae bacterium]|nr:relaxase [Rhizobiaceae bacterium]
MILKGSKRGGAADLSRHLLKAENEHVEVHEIRGFVADNVPDAFKEAQAISLGTKCRKFLFSLALSPPETESVPVRMFEEAIGAIEEKLGLQGQPRVVIFHEKEGRRHAHCVWSRIDAQTMTAIDQPHFKLKLGDISRQLYLEHGWKMPEGLIDPALRNPLNFDRYEWFQAKRTGNDPRAIKAAFHQCWAASDSGKAFRQALQSRGYYLARGDRRAVVAVDMHGEVYAVARWVGVKSKDIVDRVADIDSLPSVSEVKAEISRLVREKLAGFLGSITDEFAKAAGELEARRIAMVGRHRTARSDLQSAQEIRWAAEARIRAGRFRKGLPGLWDRVIGKHAKLRQENETEVKAAELRDAGQKQELIGRQLRERQLLQREIKFARRAHLHTITRLHKDIMAFRRVDDSIGVEVADFATSSEVRRGRNRRHVSGP